LNEGVGDDEIEPAVVVEIDEDRSEAVAAFSVSDPGFDADISERAVAIVVEKMIAFSEESHGTTKDVDAAILARAFGDAAFPGEDRSIEIVLEVAGNEEIEQAVVIVVAPSGPSRPSAERDAERAKTVRLRELRLAKEASDKAAKQTAPTKKRWSTSWRAIRRHVKLASLKSKGR